MQAGLVGVVDSEREERVPVGIDQASIARTEGTYVRSLPPPGHGDRVDPRGGPGQSLVSSFWSMIVWRSGVTQRITRSDLMPSGG